MKILKTLFKFILITLLFGILTSGFKFIIYTLSLLVKVLWLTLKLACKLFLMIFYVFTKILFWPFKNCFPAKSIDQLSGAEFEQFCCHWLELEGYRSIKQTPASADYGVDILSIKNNEKVAVQCKRYSGNVGVGAIQEISAGLPFYECQKGLVITNSKFTKNAEDLADANNILLIDGNTLNHSRACKTLTRNRVSMHVSTLIMSLFTCLSIWLSIYVYLNNRSYLPLTLMLVGICSLTLLNGILEIRSRKNKETDKEDEAEIIEELQVQK